MDFGRLPDLEGVDLSLPPDPAATRALLQRYPARTVPEVYLGLPILNDAGYENLIYPPGCKTRDQLRYYSNRFPTLEFNTTHYGIPRPHTIAQWRAAVTPNFRYVLKLPQSISHAPNLADTTPEVAQFTEVIQGLGPTLGPVFMQLPPTFGPDRLPELLRFLEAYPKEPPLTLELRDEDWFGPDAGPFEELHQALEALGIGTVLTDVAGRRDVLHMRLTTPHALVRFNGYELQASDFTRVTAWCERLVAWAAQGLQSVYFFHHQHHPKNSVDTLLFMVKELNRLGNYALPLPPLMDPNAQQSLF